jgi:hypothetical protein
MEQRRAAAMFFSLAVAAWRPISSWFYADASNDTNIRLR